MFHRFEWTPLSHNRHQRIPQQILKETPTRRKRQEEKRMSKDKQQKNMTPEPLAKNNGNGDGIKALVLAALIVGVIAAALGWFLGQYYAQAALDGADAKAALETAQQSEKKEITKITDHATIIQMEPVLTNLRESDDAWIRMEISLILTEKQSLEPEQLAEISNDFIALLHQMSFAQVKGPTGLMNLREDLLDRARVRSEGHVSAVLISTLVIE